MANTKFTGRSDSYIFEDAGGKRDQLEQAILNELQAKQYVENLSVHQNVLLAVLRISLA